MSNLIDKDALVAEIEKRIKSLYPKGGQGVVVTKILKDHYEDLLSFLNTLDVKEVDLTKEIYFYIESSITGTNPIYTKGAVSNLIEKAAKHFFELGLKVNNEKEK